MTEKNIFFEYESSQSSVWNDFVLFHKKGSIHQISAWKGFQEKIPGRSRVRGFGIQNQDTKKILATVLCVRMETGFLGKFWWYSARGPVFDPNEKLELEAGTSLIKKTREALKKEGGMFWRIDPYFTKEEYEKLWNEGTFGFSIQSPVQNYQPTDTLVIDLTKSNEEILSEMKRKGRYNIKLAGEKGVTIKAIENGSFSAQDLEDFWRLNKETTSRDKFSGHEKEYYKNFLTELKSYAVLFFAEYEGQRVATAISTFCGEKAIYYFGASTSDDRYRNLMAPYLLQWEMMQYAKKKNCTTYDFLGIAPEGEVNHKYSGISEFKWKFGGERKTYAEGKEIVLDPFWYFWYRLSKKRR